MNDVEKQAVELKNTAEQYVKYKAELDPLEKQCKSLNTTIKGLMEILKIDSVSLDDGSSVEYSVSEKVSFNEDRLVKTLKRFAPYSKAVKTKEYVDMEVLESEIYHGDLSDDAMLELDKCREVKEIPKITIKKKKKK